MLLPPVLFKDTLDKTFIRVLSLNGSTGYCIEASLFSVLRNTNCCNDCLTPLPGIVLSMICAES